MARNSSLLDLVARLLPREFRERVFEPAVADFRLDLAARPAPGRRLALELWIVAECLRLGLPQFAWRRGRPTRLAHGVMVMALVLAVVWFAVMRASYAQGMRRP